MSVPLVVGNQTIAKLVAGQVFGEKPTPRDFARLVKQLGHREISVNLTRLEKAFFHTPVLSRERLRGAFDLLPLLAQHIAGLLSHPVVARRPVEPLCVVSAKEFVSTHLSEPVKTREAAQSTHLSMQYFCKVFKGATGTTFTEYVSSVRVERAKQLLADPRTRITDVAYAAGFRSIPHFNRVFKRYGGMSPTQHRQSLTR